MHPPANLGELFSPCDLLAVSTRRRLAVAVARPGLAPPLMIEDLRKAPLPSDLEGRLAVCRVIEEGLVAATLAALAPWRLRDVVPALRHAAPRLDAALDGRSARLRDVLDRNGVDDVPTLGSCSVAEIRAWAGVGPALAAAAVGVALAAGCEALSDGLVSADAEEAPSHPLLPTLDRVLAAAGDERDLGVFELRSLRLTRRPTMAEVAEALGITYERVRQLQRGAERRVDEALVGESPADRSAVLSGRAGPGGRIGEELGPPALAPGRDPVGEVTAEASALRAEMGEATDLASIGDVLASRGLPPLPDIRSLLLVWAAGPYHPVAEHPGWVAVDPGELCLETRAILREDGGIRPIGEVEDDLRAIGVAPAAVDAWLARQPVRRTDDLVVLAAGSVAQVAERAIEAAGRALSIAELEPWVASSGGHNGAPSAGRHGLYEVMSRGRRFVRVGPDSFELAEWGASPYQDGDRSAVESTVADGATVAEPSADVAGKNMPAAELSGAALRDVDPPCTNAPAVDVLAVDRSAAEVTIEVLTLPFDGQIEDRTPSHPSDSTTPELVEVSGRTG